MTLSSVMDEAYRMVVGQGPLQKAALVAIIFTVILTLTYRRLFTVSYPKNLPRIGAQDGIPWGDMRKKFLTDCASVFNEAYENYSKKGQAVLIPVYGPHEEVILPPSAVNWLCRQPEDVASSIESQIDGLQLHHSLGHKFAYDPWSGLMIKNNMNAELESVCAIMNDEVGPAVEACFGMDVDNWKEIDLFPTCRKMLGQATMRATLGDSPEGRRLCRDETFIQSCYDVVDAMLGTAGYMAGTHRAFRSLLGRWASRAMPAKLKELKRHFEPLYRERMHIIGRQAANEDVKVPKDVMQMIFEYAAKERRKEAASLDDMTGRLALTNIGTLNQSPVQMHNMLLNIVASNAEFDTVSVLRKEVASVVGSDADTGRSQWTKAKVAAMVRADSVARETMRLDSFTGVNVRRLIVAPGGLVTEDGVHLPRGAMVSILQHQPQTDGEAFEDPLKYDPFRFSRAREAAADPATGRPGHANLSFVSTAPDYLPWSHGRHACPGRFMVDFEFKMTLAYALMNYDIEFPESYAGKRPPNTWFSGFGIPPLDAKLRVRRKKAI